MSHEATELQLYIENDYALHRRQGLPILKNLATKVASGKYEHDKAVKLYMDFAESGAKKYAKEFGGGRMAEDVPRVRAEGSRRRIHEEFRAGMRRGTIRAPHPEEVPAEAGEARHEGSPPRLT